MACGMGTRLLMEDIVIVSKRYILNKYSKRYQKDIDKMSKIDII